MFSLFFFRHFANGAPSKAGKKGKAGKSGKVSKLPDMVTSHGVKLHTPNRRNSQSKGNFFNPNYSYSPYNHSRGRGLGNRGRIGRGSGHIGHSGRGNRGRGGRGLTPSQSFRQSMERKQRHQFEKQKLKYQHQRKHSKKKARKHFAGSYEYAIRHMTDKQDEMKELNEDYSVIGAQWPDHPVFSQPPTPIDRAWSDFGGSTNNYFSITPQQFIGRKYDLNPQEQEEYDRLERLNIEKFIAKQQEKPEEKWKWDNTNVSQYLDSMYDGANHEISGSGGSRYHYYDPSSVAPSVITNNLSSDADNEVHSRTTNEKNKDWDSDDWEDEDEEDRVSIGIGNGNGNGNADGNSNTMNSSNTNSNENNEDEDEEYDYMDTSGTNSRVASTNDNTTRTNSNSTSGNNSSNSSTNIHSDSGTFSDDKDSKSRSNSIEIDMNVNMDKNRNNHTTTT